MSKSSNGDLRDNSIVCQSSLGMELHGTPVKLGRFALVFEINSPGVILRLSEALDHFKIIFHEHTIYSGKAIVQNIIAAGKTVLCAASLNESGWTQPQITPALMQAGELKRKFGEFFEGWQKSYQVQTAYKMVVADIYNFLTDLRFWIDQVEAGVHAVTNSNVTSSEDEIANNLAQYILPPLNKLFEKFESAAGGIEDGFEAAHQVYARRQLHPLLLCSPFLYRTYSKPLGYAGDYEMVNMIMRPPLQGDSMYAKIINSWFLIQAPAEAHRNRIKYLAQKLVGVSAKAIRSRRRAKVLNLGCGPAHEVLVFLRESDLSNNVDFTLLDFNTETIEATGSALDRTIRQLGRRTGIALAKKSVNQIIKESEKMTGRQSREQYDFVYCAGLYDYLFDSVCQRLTGALHELVAPGGFLVITNVDFSNPRQFIMNYIMDWHLIYRNATQVRKFKPDGVLPEDTKIISDITGVNIYFEIPKSDHG